MNSYNAPDFQAKLTGTVSELEKALQLTQKTTDFWKRKFDESEKRTKELDKEVEKQLEYSFRKSQKIQSQTASALMHIELKDFINFERLAEEVYYNL